MNLIYPMFAMVLLTLATLIAMFVSRMTAIRTGKVSLGYFKTYTSEAPDKMIQTSRHYSNLFEMPVLFYAACLVAMVRDMEGGAIAVWAWIFVAARIVQAFIHLGNNKVPPRALAFAISVIAVLAMWFILVLAPHVVSA